MEPLGRHAFHPLHLWLWKKMDEEEVQRVVLEVEENDR
jgi:hypothetical protein